MIYDSLGYFVLITASNVINLILFLTNQQTQSAAVSLSYLSIWIMTQRILIDLHEASMQYQDGDVFTTTPSTVKTSPALRRVETPTESNKNKEWTEPSLGAIHSAEHGEAPLDIRSKGQDEKRIILAQ